MPLLMQANIELRSISEQRKEHLMQADIIGGYFCEELQHWVKIIRPTRDKRASQVYSKVRFRMTGSERKIKHEPTAEDELRQKAVRFISRKENKEAQCEKT